MAIVYDDARIATIKEQIAKETAAGDLYEVQAWERELQSTMFIINAKDEKEREEKTDFLNKANKKAMSSLVSAQEDYSFSVSTDKSFRKVIAHNARRGHETSNAEEILADYAQAINYKWNVLRVAEQKAMATSLQKETHDAYCAFRNMAKLPQISYDEMKEMLAAAPEEASNASDREVLKAYWVQKTAEMRSRYWSK
jgi:hypothetical protein